MKKLILFIAIFVLFSMTSPTFSDEVWNSTFGEVIYAEDIGPTAMWTYAYNNKPGIIYILGLAANYNNRGTYDGYWAQTITQKRCNTKRLGPGKMPTHHWGRFYISFIDKGFPARWTAKWSYCDAVPSQKWNGKPR